MRLLDEQSGASFSMVSFDNANLESANRSGTNLHGTNLRGANLRNANLCRAYLDMAYLFDTDLNGADLTNATIGWTDLSNCDFRIMKGLETIKHCGPSFLSINSIYLSQGEIPEAFVRGTGAPDIFIEYLRSLASKSRNYYTCFISYSHQNKEFARRLHADLQAQGVSCWFAPEDMRIGDKLRSRIDEAIHLQDKLLLLLSEHSLASGWIEDEVDIAFTREREQKREVLFPVRLDDAVMEARQPWAKKLRDTRHIGNFTNWTDPQAYEQALARLLSDLKAQTNEPMSSQKAWIGFRASLLLHSPSPEHSYEDTSRSS